MTNNEGGRTEADRRSWGHRQKKNQKKDLEHEGLEQAEDDAEQFDVPIKGGSSNKGRDRRGKGGNNILFRKRKWGKKK